MDSDVSEESERGRKIGRRERERERMEKAITYGAGLGEGYAEFANISDVLTTVSSHF
jgi:hypothetical protein